MPKETLPNTPSMPTGSYFPSWETLSTLGWQAANFAVGMIATSTALTAVRSPLESLILEDVKPGRVLPSSSGGRGFLTAARMLYVGSGPSFATSNVKTIYTAGTANVKKSGLTSENMEISGMEISGREEVTSTKKYETGKFAQLGPVAAVAAGYVVISQYETTGLLLKLNIIPQGFNWRTPMNAWYLATTALGARYSSALINFSALLMLEKKVADSLPRSDTSLNHFVAGGISGLVSGMLSLPSNLYRYHVLTKSVMRGSDWIPPGAINTATETIQHIKSVGAREATTQAIQLYAKHLPKSVMMTASTFAIISGLNTFLGEEPLAPLKPSPTTIAKGSAYIPGFFSRPVGPISHREERGFEPDLGPFSPFR